MKRSMKRLPRWAQVAIVLLELAGFAVAVFISVASAGMADSLFGWFGVPLAIAMCLIGFGVIVWIASRLDK